MKCLKVVVHCIFLVVLCPFSAFSWPYFSVFLQGPDPGLAAYFAEPSEMRRCGSKIGQDFNMEMTECANFLHCASGASPGRIPIFLGEELSVLMTTP